MILFAWAGVSSAAGGFYAWVVVFGFFGAAIQGLFPSSLACLTADPSKVGTRMGMVFSLMSVVVLTGPPLAGQLIETAGGDYIGVQMWAGACMLVGVCVLVAARVAMFGWELKRAA